MTLHPGQIWIITGPREVGKTRFCANLIKKAREQNMIVEGMICPPEYSKKEKTSIGIENLKTGEKFILARVRSGETEGLLTDHWIFDPDVMEWGNQVLGEVQPCDLLVVDELGPLEFNRGEGWQNGLHLLDGRKFQIAVVVIRPELITVATTRWPNARVMEIPTGISKVLENTYQQMILNQ
jgi:nucleoside-triphosphatase